MASRTPLKFLFVYILLVLLCFATSHVSHQRHPESPRRTWTFRARAESNSNSNSNNQHSRGARQLRSVEQLTITDLAAENRVLWAGYRSKTALRDLALEILQKETTASTSFRHHRYRRDPDPSPSPLLSSIPAGSDKASHSGTGVNADDKDLQSQNSQLRDVLGDLEALMASLARLLADELPGCNGDGPVSGSSDATPSSSVAALPGTVASVATPSVNLASPMVPIRTIATQISSSSSTLPPSALASSVSATASYHNSNSSSSPATAISPFGPTPSTPDNTPTHPQNSNTTASAFDPMSSSNLAVYYGQTPATASVPLSQLCNDPSIDIVILAFITSLSSSSSSSSSSTTQYFPTLNLGPYCAAGPSAAQSAAGATGLLDCTADLAPQVQACQARGKKVLISLGGATGTGTIESDEAAEGMADSLWSLFGGGDGMDGLRPFGEAVVLDGFDDDNETHSTAHWPALLRRLRSHFRNATSTSTSTKPSKSAKSKPYFLSAAPQCPRPDASIDPTSLRTLVDFVWVQFYNNPGCQLSSSATSSSSSTSDSSGQSASRFFESLHAWSSDLSGSSSSSSASDAAFVDANNGVTGGPRLYVGAPSWPRGVGSAGGYVDAETLVQLVGRATKEGGGVGNLGGVMLWDGAQGEGNGGFVETVKRGLLGGGTGGGGRGKGS